MRLRYVFLIGFFMVLAMAWHAGASETAEAVMEKVEERYDCESLSADFKQISVFAEMDIEDTAHGKVMFKRPDKVRWEYKSPYPQLLISDGDSLWIYKPEENQVIVGKAEALMGKGNSASFMADIFSLQKNFIIETADSRKKEGYYVLRLEPKEKVQQLAVAYLFVSRKTYIIEELETETAFGEVTRFTFENIKFNADIAAAKFEFDIPIDADIIAMDPLSQ
ncbi:MAG: outer membrane lipoprotein carrier protein LolA [Thermodesulfobacteriota bacterium]|nr:outer membrane lipoprotein carrier protein LolA [Thermodesulfobacteriota bacterium]